MTRDSTDTLARIDLTAALRSASRMGLGEGICNHFSLALPSAPGHFLINPQGLHWSEITPADLLWSMRKGARSPESTAWNRRRFSSTVGFIAVTRTRRV